MRNRCQQFLRFLISAVACEAVPSGNALAILALGQSNIANEGDAAGIHIAGPNVYNFNILDGQMYHARDPLLQDRRVTEVIFLSRLGDLS